MKNLLLAIIAFSSLAFADTQLSGDALNLKPATLPACTKDGQIRTNAASEVYVCQTGSWVQIGTGGGGSGNVSNGGNSFGSNFTVGSNDYFSTSLRSNNAVQATVDPNGYWGIGTNPQTDTTQSDKVLLFAESIGSGVQKNYSGLVVENRLWETTDGTGYQQGIQGIVHSEADTSNYALLRNYFMAESVGDGTIHETYGARALTRIYDKNYPSQTSTGTIENGFGLEAYAHSTSSTATMQNATGIVISNAVASGPNGGVPFAARGLWIRNDISATGGSTNEAWAIDSEAVAPSKLTGDLYLNDGAKLRLLDADGSNYVEVGVPSTVSTNRSITLPADAPTAGYCVQTDASGVWSYAACGGGGGSGDVNFGGNTFGANKYIGSNDAYKLSLATNGTNRLNIASTGEVTIGGDVGDFSTTPQQFGVTKFSTVDPYSNHPFNVFDQAFAYYGNSSTSFDGTLYQLALRPGETYFTYGGEFNTLSVRGFVSQPGTVGTLSGMKAIVDVPNGSGVLNYGFGQILSVSASGGQVQRAYGSQVQILSANRSGTNNEAVGIDIGSSSIAATNGSSNTAIGLRINDSITGDSGSTWAILSNSVAPSYFAGAMTLDNGGVTTDGNGYMTFNGSGGINIQGSGGIDFGPGTPLYFNGQDIANINSIQDTSSVKSIDPTARQLFDTGGTNATLDYQNRQLIDSSSGPAVDWENKTLRASSIDKIDWSAAKLVDATNAKALSWEDRKLYATDGTTVVLDWTSQQTTDVSSAIFTSNSGTGINSASTFDGYTVAQVVRALRNLGLLQ